MSGLDLCPRCGGQVDADGTGMRAPVRWEGGLRYGHHGCLADVQHERGQWASEDSYRMSEAERALHPENE